MSARSGMSVIAVCILLTMAALAQGYWTFAPLRKAPTKACSKKNPLANDPDAIPAGAKLFAEHCAECHGEAARGGRRAPSLRCEPVRQASAGALFWIVTNGVVRRGMPVWSKLPKPERWQIVAYLQSLNSQQ